jgi:hypothetical protein
LALHNDGHIRANQLTLQTPTAIFRVPGFRNKIPLGIAAAGDSQYRFAALTDAKMAAFAVCFINNDFLQ